jgi:hypothetical protein
LVIVLNLRRIGRRSKSYKPLLLTLIGGSVLYIVGLCGLWAPIWGHRGMPAQSQSPSSEP